jgi:hypothetical protein
MCRVYFYLMEGSGGETEKVTVPSLDERSTTAASTIDLYDEPEDLNTQTVIQNRYCFWCHRRGGKASVDLSLCSLIR